MQCEKSKLTIIAVGDKTVSAAVKVANQLNCVDVVEATTVKPLDEELLDNLRTENVLTLEENVLQGGFGQSVVGYFARKDRKIVVKCLGVDDDFVKHAQIAEQLQQNGLDFDGIYKIACEMLSKA